MLRFVSHVIIRDLTHLLPNKEEIKMFIAYFFQNKVNSTYSTHPVICSHCFPQSTTTINYRKDQVGTSLVVQWLRLCAPSAEASGLIPGQETGSRMLQLKILYASTKIPCAAAKTRCSQNK